MQENNYKKKIEMTEGQLFLSPRWSEEFLRKIHVVEGPGFSSLKYL